MKDYSKLFTRINMGRLEVKNRIGMAAMNTHFNEGDNELNMTRWASKFYEERAKGGVGLIVSGHIKAESTIDPYPVHVGFPVLDNDNRIKDFAEMCDAVHRYGAKIITQLSAGSGRNADDFLPGKEPISSSNNSLAYMPHLKARELTIEEIHQLAKSYGEAALRCKKAGFDGIMIHAHAQLIDQFLSKVWNQRTDEYGGSLENRLRFFGECYESARSLVGNDYPIFVGLSIDHGFEGGRTVEKSIELCKTLEEKYDIDGFYIADGSYDAMSTLNAHYPENSVGKKAQKLAKAIQTPIMTVGRYSNPDDALEAVEEGIAMPTLGRALVGEPNWANKVRLNKVDDIRPCLRCMECMDRIIVQHKFCGCAVNPVVGHEREGSVELTQNKKKVVIVGGGPAGMQAALTADLRGHDVTLIEKQPELGGRLIEASVPDYKYRINDYNQYMTRTVSKSNVTVMINTEANDEIIEELQPDTLIIASGAKATVPSVKGKEKGVLAEDILRGNVAPAETVTVIGGGLVGSEVAYHLAKQGKKVSIIEMREELLLDDSVMNKYDLIKDLMGMQVDIHVNTTLQEIKDNQVIVVNKDKEQLNIETDQVVFAVGFKSDKNIYDKMIMKVEEVYEIGDAFQVGKIYHASNSGYLLAKEL